MHITWLGQAGLLFEIDGKKIIVDPYLSDYVKEVEPNNYRRQPIDGKYLELSPDIIVVTHNHLDHLDKETLKHYLTPEAALLVLAPNGSWQELRKSFPSKANYVLFNNGTTWTEGNVTFRAVKAEHSDPYAIGVVITAEGKNYYITGDTLYSESVFDSIPDITIDAVFLPINGKGNNMNAEDAKKFAIRIGARHIVPMHFGLFDCMTGAELDAPNSLVPEIYCELTGI